jgi:hypothetical protein
MRVCEVSCSRSMCTRSAVLFVMLCRRVVVMLSAILKDLLTIVRSAQLHSGFLHSGPTRCFFSVCTISPSTAASSIVDGIGT